MAVRNLSFSVVRSKSQPRSDLPYIRYAAKISHKFSYLSPVQSLDWDPAGDSERIAFGHQDGSVSIQSLSEARDVFKIAPKQQRSCTSVRFRDSNMLAIGLDKVRNDASLSIYDLESQSVSGAFANSECVSALAWVPHDANVVLAALNYRWLRLFDIRMDSKESLAALSVPTKAVYELTVDELNSYSFASTYDNNVLVWDLRHFSDAALSLKASTGPRGSRVNQLKFRPDRRSHLAGLSDDGTLDLWQLDNVEVEEGQYRVSRHHCRTCHPC